MKIAPVITGKCAISLFYPLNVAAYTFKNAACCNVIYGVLPTHSWKPLFPLGNLSRELRIVKCFQKQFLKTFSWLCLN